VLADPELVGTGAMSLERVTLEPGSRSPELTGGEGERFVYVIRGSGTIDGSTGAAALAPESIVWLEDGDRVRLAAGPDGMQVLVAGAWERLPASEG
jgi:quercetin dioxygenase-like cupin family protein